MVKSFLAVKRWVDRKLTGAQEGDPVPGAGVISGAAYHWKGRHRFYGSVDLII